MFRKISSLSLALAMTFASAVLVSAQVASSPTDGTNPIEPSASPVAYVFVSSSPASGSNQVNAFAAASSGALAPIPGSPFSTDVSYLAVNGKYLFGTDGINIDSFSIASNGAIKQVNSYTAEPGGGLISIYLDHTGTSLYADYYTTNNDYLSYTIDNATGAVTFIKDLPEGPPNNSPVSFIGSNQFAYSSSCYHYDPEVYGVQRADNGALISLNTSIPFPTAPPGDFFCPWLATADPTDHLAVAMQPLNGIFVIVGPYQLASYTADSSGNLTTSSSYSTMPKVAVSTVQDYRMSPSGTLLAVGGTSGLQVFHFNGANPITKYTGLLTATEIDQVFWDNDNHLYAISRTTGKLFVFTVTPTRVAQAPGSPHSIAGLEYFIVLPKT